VYGIPHGWANSSRSLPKRSVSVTSIPALRSRSAQKPSAPVGTDRSSAFIWFVPRLPIQPAWRYGNAVRIVLASPAPLP
jgi:hypothetical protein